MTQSQGLSSAIPPVAFERPACPRCKARMMLVSIEPERPGVDLQIFQCAVCNHVLPRPLQALGRWLLGCTRRGNAAAAIAKWLRWI
jgi:hypothetical protein